MAMDDIAEFAAVQVGQRELEGGMRPRNLGLLRPRRQFDGGERDGMPNGFHGENCKRRKPPR